MTQPKTLSSPKTAEAAERYRRARSYRSLGSWQLVHSAGDGQFAQVFFGRPLGAGDERCDYAIKELRQEYWERTDAVARFQQEAVLGISVAHPNLTTVLSAEVESAPFYLVMPRLRGATTARLIQDVGPLDVPLALWITRQVAQALAALHASGWLHADVKPDNVFIAADGHATLFDLGLAVAIGGESAQFDEMLCGTLDYAAPESFTSTRALCAASDIYSLGVMLYELLTGCRPFSCTTAAECVEAHLHEMAPSLRTHNRRVPREVAALVARMMSKEPTRRPTLAELRSQLTRMEIESFSLHRSSSSIWPLGNAPHVIE